MKGTLWSWLALAAPSLAHGAAYDVEARTEAQAYTVGASSPESGRALTRRRLVQSLDLAGFEVVTGEDAGLSLRLRLDADFAVNDRELSGLDGGWRDRLQLLAGRLHWNGLAGGRLDLEAGRIAAADPVGSWQLDGGRATVRPWPFLALTAFGGLRVTGASWMASGSVLAPDGTRDSDRRRIAAGLPTYPCPAAPTRDCADETLDDPAPTYGVRLALTRIPGDLPGAGSLELSYHRTLRGGAILEERLAGGGRYRLGRLGLEAAAEYDLYLARFSALRAGLRVAALPGLALALEGLQLHPSFGADAIWNLFVTAPTREVRLRADLAPASWPARLHAAAGLKQYAAPDFSYPDLPATAAWEPSGALGVEAELGATRLAADATVRAGAEGTQAWVTALLRRAFRSWIGLEGRATLAFIEDRVMPRNGGTFPAVALILSGRLERRAQLALLIEDSSPRGARNDLRLFAFLTLGADWDTRFRT